MYREEHISERDNEAYEQVLDEQKGVDSLRAIAQNLGLDDSEGDNDNNDLDGQEARMDVLAATAAAAAVADIVADTAAADEASGQDDLNSPASPGISASLPVYTTPSPRGGGFTTKPLVAKQRKRKYSSPRSAGDNLVPGGVPSVLAIETSNKTPRAATAAPAFTAAASVPASDAAAEIGGAPAFTPASGASPPLPPRTLPRPRPSPPPANTPTSTSATSRGGRASPLGDSTAAGIIPLVQRQPIILGSGVGGAAAFIPVAEQQGAATFALPAPPAPADNLYGAEEKLREVMCAKRNWEAYVEEHGGVLERKEAEAKRLVMEATSAAAALSAAKRIQAKELVASTKRDFVVCDESIAKTKRLQEDIAKRKEDNAKQRRFLVKEGKKLEKLIVVEIAAQKMAGTKASAAAETLDALA
jgi:hypothetical protein